MARVAKKKVAFTISPENVDWLQQLSETTGISMSLFIDSFLSGARMSTKEGVSEREAMSTALEQIAKGIGK
jgi:hypothetical protein